jgi:cell division protein ZapA
MSELSIKVIIAGRTYPLSIERDEEETVRTAANRINEAIRALQESYAVKDTQDLLAMAALQLIIQGSYGNTGTQEDPAVRELLLQISHSLSAI